MFNHQHHHFLAVAFSAFMIPTVVHAAMFPASALQTVKLAVNPACTAAAVNLDATPLGLGSGTNLLDPAGIAVSDSMAAANSNVRNVVLDQADDLDNHFDRPRHWHDGDPGGAPTPEPSSVLLFAVGLSR